MGTTTASTTGGILPRVRSRCIRTSSVTLEGEGTNYLVVLAGGNYLLAKASDNIATNYKELFSNVGMVAMGRVSVYVPPPPPPPTVPKATTATARPRQRMTLGMTQEPESSDLRQ